MAVVYIILAFQNGMGNCPEPTMTIRPHSCYRKIGTKSTLTKGDRWLRLVEGNLIVDIIKLDNLDIIKVYIAEADGHLG